ncbi:MAG: SLC13 family permease [Candidatus Hadarchaeum sp.]|uniref:SLC13 family permease n=1 Tax=Candidatus Hadarchaeum sp. TaxID=2883567 RepID=UPI003D09DC71
MILLNVIPLNAVSIVSILIFAVTIFLVFRHPILRIPFTRRYVHVDYGLAPLLGACFLFLSQSIGIEAILRGILGTDSVKPYAIIIMILSLSYICVSLDFTGFFEYVSLRVARASKGSGKRLFVYLFLLTSFLTLFTDNDIVILTMTLIIFYISRNAGLDPIPFLISQFFAVNILGMALYIGNPTNIIAADAYGLSFKEFARWMLIPSFSAAAVCLLLLWLIFRRRVSREFRTREISPEHALKDRNGAIFGTTVLGLMILFMSLPLGIPLWMIALFFALIMFLFDLLTHRANISKIVTRMPWKIAPFLAGLFIIVEGLASTGWTDLFASLLSKITGNLMATVFGVCFLSWFATGFMNNHPMSIFFVKTFQSSAFTVSHTSRLGATLALISGANFGANFTLIGALAGIMWINILAAKGVTISFSQFSKYGLLVMPIVIIVTCLAFIAELTLWA